MRTAFQTVIPERYLEFWAVQDVPSTRIKNGVTRAIESKALSRLVGRTILLLQFFEARGWIRADHTDMLIKETPERVIGSHFVQVSKPEQVLCKVDQS